VLLTSKNYSESYRVTTACSQNKNNNTASDIGTEAASSPWNSRSLAIL